MPPTSLANSHHGNPEFDKLEPRERLVWCARDLFQQKTFDGVNIREIMSAANVTQPTIYYYFQNKDGLFLTALLDVLQEIDESFNEALRQPDFTTQLRAITAAFCNPPPPNLPLLFHDLNQRVQINSRFANQGIAMNEARKAYLYVNQIWPRALENTLRLSRHRAEIQASNPVFIAHYLLTTLTTYSHSAFNQLTSSSPDQSLETLVEYLLASMRVNLTGHI